MDAVDHSIDLTGVSKRLPDEIKEDYINIDVNQIKEIDISNNDNTQLKGLSMVVVEKLSRKSKIIKKILHEDRESLGVTGRQSSDDVVMVVDSDRNKIEQCIEIQTSKLKFSKKKLYRLIASRMDKDDPSEYCCRLRQVDAEQVLIKVNILELKVELRALGISCRLKKMKVVQMCAIIHIIYHRRSKSQWFWRN